MVLGHEVLPDCVNTKVDVSFKRIVQMNNSWDSTVNKLFEIEAIAVILANPKGGSNAS